MNPIADKLSNHAANLLASDTRRPILDVALGSQYVSVMVDLGLIDPLGRVGFEVEPATYNAIYQSGGFSRFSRRSRRDASGSISFFDTGRTSTQLVDPISRIPVGPVVPLFVASGTPGVAGRVGVVFFHRLTGCRISWELDQQTWIVDYP